MITIKQLGIGKAVNKKYCSIIGNKDIATHYIGDVKSPHKPANVYVNEEILRELYKEIGDILGITSSEVFKPLTVNEASMYEDYVKYLYSTSNSATKAGLQEFCKSHDIKLPENPDDLRVKDYLDLIFPELKV